MSIKGELFSQQFIPMLLDGTKTRTSRPLKLPKWITEENRELGQFWVNGGNGNDTGISGPQELETIWHISPIHVGDIIYARETWRVRNVGGDFETNSRWDEIEFKSGGSNFVLQNVQPEFEKWRKGAKWNPSIFMPREAARIFLRITDVKVQKLDELTEQDAIADGFKSNIELSPDGTDYRGLYALDRFSQFWRDTYGSDKPWMWVYYFERISKEEAEGVDAR